MLTFILCVLGLRLSLSIAKYAWSIVMRIGHPQLSGLVQDYALEPTVSILLPVLTKGQMCTTPSGQFSNATIRQASLELSPPMTAHGMTAGSGFKKRRR